MSHVDTRDALCYDGGPDGLVAVRRLLQALPRLLSDSGHASLVATSLAGAGRTALVEELTAAEWARELDVTLVTFWQSAIHDPEGWLLALYRVVGEPEDALPSEPWTSVVGLGITAQHGNGGLRLIAGRQPGTASWYA